MSATKLPKGISNFFLCTFFDYTTLLIIVGAPMILYLKKLGVPAVLLGLPVSLFYLLDILQIPAASHVKRAGYKRFVLCGWILQAIFALGITMIAILSMEAFTKIVWVGALLFFFNASRSATYCGVLPWLTHLAPESLRGKVVARDQIFRHAGMLFSSVAVAAYLYYFSDLKYFAPLFAYAFAAIVIGALFLRRLPDAKVEHEHKRAHRVKLQEIWKNIPFRRLLIFNFLIFFANGGGMVFYVSFLKDMYGVKDSFILTLGIIYGVTALLTLPFAGKIIDRTGSRPFLIFTNFVFIIHFIGWGLVAARVWPLNWTVVCWQQITAGLSFSIYYAANVRMAMTLVPADKRSHFFAAFNVVKNLTIGGVPFLWGWMIDRLEGWNGIMGSFFEWNTYSVFYVLLILILMGALLYSQTLEETGSMKTRIFLKELFVKSPARAIARLWNREDIVS
ncbi:MAG: MFS transporter [Verrucomicrobiota bacterium]